MMRRVALLIEATNAYARGLLHGVARYQYKHASWTVYFEPHALRRDEPLPQWLKNWEGDGVLARIESQRLARAVLALGLPTVELRRVISIPGIPSIGPDNRAVAQLAATHLYERGFRSFAFCGFARGQDPPMDDRADAFGQHLREAGLPCSYFPASPRATWREEEQRMSDWLRGLSQPLGVMAADDNRGLAVLRSCLRAGLKVPDQVAVIGAGNDDCLCSLAHPPLSSIDLAPELIGYEAAALLERLMRRRYGSHAEHIQVPPRGVVTRLSTDVLATKDTAVAQAVGFIRGRACENIHARDVLRHANLSRSALEPRMRNVLGRTIHQEIVRVRLERAKALLANTDLPVKQIAAQTGFRNVQYLGLVFRKKTGQTPANFRRQMRR